MADLQGALRHHPLRPPQAAASAAPAWPTFTGKATLVGTSSSGVTVYVDEALGAAGRQNAESLLSAADEVVAQNNAIFGITGGDVSVIVYALGGSTDGTGGADHAGCDFAVGNAIEVDAAFGSPNRVIALFEAELSECAMNGSLCGYSTGEALSRWCAAVASANALSDFATAPAWVQAGMPDWVGKTEHTDQDAVSTGCGTAFISWLLSQGENLSQIAQAMVHLGDSGTLAGLYAQVTGDAAKNAWPKFEAAVKALPGGVTTDDPFNAMSSAVPTPTSSPAPTPTSSPGSPASTPASGPIKRVVIMVQENHTIDSYFRGLAPYGANVATDWPIATNPPARDQPHDRKAYYEWLTGASTGEHVQFDTAAVLPYYLYLAVTGAFLENHCSEFGTNSTANHLGIVGGQSPTLKNPSFSHPPTWDMPSLPGLAGDNGVSWRAYAGSHDYPLAFYTQLKGSANVVPNGHFVNDAKAGNLPELVMLWHDGPFDEHPPVDVTKGMDLIWRSVDAVVQAGGWEETVFMLTWDDWGGFDDHVKTPVFEYTPDNVQLVYGPRIPLVMFGGHVKAGIDSRWCGHASITKTAIDLLGLPALGVPRVDQAPSLADLTDPSQPAQAAPPAYGSTLSIPPPPSSPVAPHPLPPPPVATPSPVGDIILRGGGTMPPPNDAPLPHQPSPPTNA